MNTRLFALISIAEKFALSQLVSYYLIERELRIIETFHLNIYYVAAVGEPEGPIGNPLRVFCAVILAGLNFLLICIPEMIILRRFAIFVPLAILSGLLLFRTGVYLGQ